MDSLKPAARSEGVRPAVTRRSGVAAVVVAAAHAVAACAPALPPSVPSRALDTRTTLDLPSEAGALVHLPVAEAVTVVDAFAPTCEPCAKKLPALLARRGDIEAAGGKLVLVAVLSDGEGTSDAKAALPSRGVEASFLVDRGGALGRVYAIDNLPDTVVVSRAGIVLWMAGPTRAADDVVAAVRALAGR